MAVLSFVNALESEVLVQEIYTGKRYNYNYFLNYYEPFELELN